MANEKKYKFAEKSHAQGGIWSLSLGGAALFLLGVASVISAVARGEAGISIGAVGLVAMLLSVYGFFIGMRSFREPGASTLFPVLGSLVSGITSVLWLAVLLMGVGA